jgi:hypothetical protein
MEAPFAPKSGLFQLCFAHECETAETLDAPMGRYCAPAAHKCASRICVLNCFR